MIHFKFGLSKSFTNTITQAVGPTTVNGARTLPQPSVGDGTCFFVAPNGSDAATGNEGDPFLTISFGIAALTGPRNTLHIERNGYVGDMEFTESGAVLLGTNENLQVATPDTAKITFTGAVSGIRVLGGEINGIFIEGDSADPPTGPAVTGYGVIENCNVDNPHSVAVGHNAGTGSFSVNYCTLKADVTPFALLTSSDVPFSITNSILISRNDDTGASSPECVTIIVPAAGVAQTHTISRTIFANCDTAIRLSSGGATPRADVVDIDSCAFIDIGQGFDFDDTVGDLAGVTINNDFNYMPVSPIQSTIFSTSGRTFTNTNELDSTVPPLFVDQQGAIDAGTADGFRLQLAGKSTPDGTGRYFISSPLENTGLAGVDVAPWDETVSAVPTLVYDNEFDLQYQPGSITTEHMPQQVQSGVDLRGNLHEVTEGNKRAWSLSWGSYQNNRDRINLVQLLADPGSVQFHLLGDGVTNFTHTSLGSFDSTTGILSPTGLPSLLIPGNWAGFWCVIGSDDFYIVSNTTTTLTLVDKIGSGFPASGSVNFSVPYILVRAEKVPLTVNQENGTEFTRGGAIAELEIRETAAFEPNGGQIRFREIEDPDDGVF